MKHVSKAVLLSRRPGSFPSREDFAVAELSIPALLEGQFLVQNRWMSVDPYMRGRMYDRPSYIAPFVVGQPMEGHAIGVVIESKNSAFVEGDIIYSMLGWREKFISDGTGVEKLQVSEVPEETYLGVLGLPGFTAYGGLIGIAAPKGHETVFVSAAAGAVGSAVIQIARNLGCRVIGSAGSEEKCAWLRSIGIDHTINYNNVENLSQELRRLAPNGLDIYFDNVGGRHLQAALDVANPFSTFVECGMISQARSSDREVPNNLIHVVSRRIRMQGFISTDFNEMKDDFVRDMTAWISAGKIKWEHTVYLGIDNAVEAFMDIFAGANSGKMMVKLS